MAERTPRSRSLRLWLAVLVPLLVFTSGFLALQRPDRATGKALAFERKLQAYNTDVLVLGSSLARTNVRTDQLATELGVPKKNVVMLTLPNATAAHWYAIMRNRVFANGHRPRVIVLVGALTTMVTPEILMDSNVERLMNQLSDDEPVIGEKVLGTTSPTFFQYLFMRERAGAIRDALLMTWRDWALAMMFGENGKLAEGRRLAERANELVFADEAMDYTLHNQQSTGLYGGAVEQIDLSGLDVANDSLIPDIGALAAQYGSTVVFVRTPFPPSNADNDFVDHETERETARVMEAAGAGYLDLRSLNLDDSYFQDMRHMSREGATLFTSALATWLRNLGVLGGAGVAQVEVGLQVTDFTRVGEGPTLDLSEFTREGPCMWRLPLGAAVALSDAALVAAGHAGASPLRITYAGEPVPWRDLPASRCEWGARIDAQGLHLTAPTSARREDLQIVLASEVSFPVADEEQPAWWVYPGTTLRLGFDQPWPHSAEDFEVYLLGHVFGGGDRSPVVRVGGSEAPTERLRQRTWLSKAFAPPSGAPWSLEIEVPADGPWLLVQNLAVGVSPRTSHFIGLPEQLNGASIRMVGGKVEDTHLDPTYRTPPPSLPPIKMKKAPRDVAMVALPELAELADAPHPRASRPHKCSPIRILENGVPLAVHHEVCLNMANLKAGRSCHAGNMLYFSASDGSSPFKNGRDYDFVLDESRICDRRNQRDTTPLRGVLWLYPGDQLVLQLPADRLATFYDGANRLEVEVEAPIHVEGEKLDLRLFVDGTQVLQADIDAPVSRRKVHELILDPALPPRAQDVRLEVRNPSPTAYWLLLMATLSESYDYGFAPPPAEAAPDEALDTDLPVGNDVDPEAVGGDELFGEEVDDPFAGEVVAVADGFPTTPDLGLRTPKRIERIGAPPAPPAVKDPKSVREGVFDGRVFALWPISNSVLEKLGMGWWSPVQVLEGGTPLLAAGSRKVLRTDCGGCFLHMGQSFIVRTRSGQAQGLSLRLDEALPGMTASGQAVHWVYPGTSARYGVDKAWRGERVQVRAEISIHATDKQADGPPPVLRVGGVEAVFEAVDTRQVAVLDLPQRGTGAWQIEVVVPDGGPYVLLHELKVADADGVATWVQRPVPPVRTEDEDEDEEP